MCVAPVVKMSVLLVKYCGVGIKAHGVSAHGLPEVGGDVVIVKGARWRNRARIVESRIRARAEWFVRDIARGFLLDSAS